MLKQGIAGNGDKQTGNVRKLTGSENYQQQAKGALGTAASSASDCGMLPNAFIFL